MRCILAYDSFYLHRLLYFRMPETEDTQFAHLIQKVTSSIQGVLPIFTSPSASSSSAWQREKEEEPLKHLFLSIFLMGP